MANTNNNNKEMDMQPASFAQVWQDIKVPALIAAGIIILSYFYVHFSEKRKLS